MTGRSSLFDLLGDPIGRITTFLSSTDIYRLWKCGNTLLQARLRQEVTQFTIGGPEVSQLKLIPGILYNFVQIRTLHIEYGEQSRSMTPKLQSSLLEWIDHINTLPSLESLFISTQAGSDIWDTMFMSMNNASKSLKTLFPRLKTFYATARFDENLGYFIPLASWKSLPSSLESIIIRGLSAEVPDLEELLPNLTHLELNANQVGSLPPSLTHLQLGVLGSVLNAQGVFRWSLPNLRVYNIQQRAADRKTAFPNFSSLFPNLETLVDSQVSYSSSGFYSTDFAISLPQTLTCLHLSAKIKDTVQFISVLPRSVVDLSLIYSFYDNYEDDAHLSFLRSLPRGLTRLRTNFVRRPRPILKPWSDEELEALPRSLTDLDILRAKGFQPHQSIGTLLPNLKEIPMGVPFNAVKVLPSSLTRVESNIADLELLNALRSFKGLRILVARLESDDMPLSVDGTRNIGPVHLLRMDHMFSRDLLTLSLSIFASQNRQLSVSISFGSDPDLDSFHSLHTLTIDAQRELLFEKSAWPSTLRKLELKTIKPVDLGSLLEVTPPSLTDLSCEVVNVKDRNIMELPTSLVRLVVRMLKSEKYATYHPTTLAHLPPSLTLLDFPMSLHERKSDSVLGLDVDLIVASLPASLVHLRIRDPLASLHQQHLLDEATSRWNTALARRWDLRGQEYIQRTTDANINFL